MEQLHLFLSSSLNSDNLNKYLETGNNINPLPMQYLGSKARITHWLLDSIENEFSECDTFVDLFSGTGSVALEAIARGYSIITNDIQPYSYAVSKALFSLPKDNLKEIIHCLEGLKNEKYLLNGSRYYFTDILIKEDNFFKILSTKSFKWESYREFCNTTPIIDRNSKLEIPPSHSDWHLFCQYYMNNYFGVRQSLEIDTIREYADNSPHPQKEIILAAVISVLTFAVSSTTHLAQYLKPNSNKQAQFLLKKRSISIINGVISRIKNLLSFNNYTGSKNYNLDFMDALRQIPQNSNTVVYADPPYFKEHYSRYYHVLDTFYLYDYPRLTMNERTLDITMGRYRENRIRSDFGLKSRVIFAFESLLKECRDKGFRVAISYADTSLVSAKQILEIIKSCDFKAVVKQKGLLHSSQGQPGNKIAQEYLYLLTS